MGWKKSKKYYTYKAKRPISIIRMRKGYVLFRNHNPVKRKVYKTYKGAAIARSNMMRR